MILIRLFLITLLITICLADMLLSETQYNALKDLYNSTQGLKWSWKTSYSHYGYPWNFTNNLYDPCNQTHPWQGITCDWPCSKYPCNVKVINLVNFGLNGSLPISIGNFDGLTGLSLSENHLTGTLPSSIGLLVNIQSFDIEVTYFTGSLPDIFENLTLLSSFSFDYNYFTGSLPSSLFNLINLRYFSFENTLISGELPLNIGNCKSLQYLWANENSLTGQIPESIGSLQKLQYLFIQDNLFSNTLPPAIGNMTKINEIIAQNNLISGSIPSEIGRCTSLMSLFLYYNLFTGSIPQDLSHLTKLTYLYLSINSFSGSIPPGLSNMTRLLSLFLNDNYFSGSIPEELSNFPKLTILMLFQNRLEGTIPSSLANLPRVTYLFLGNNELTGSIPSSFGNSTSLINFILNTNKLTGTIPSELSNAKKLSNFICYENQLTGSIPEEFGNLPYLENLNVYDNLLTGTIPNTLNDLPLLSVLDLESNLFTGTIPGYILYLSNLAYLYLANNQFSGDLLFNITNNSSKLQELVCFNNIFTGLFPIYNSQNISNALIILDISSNMFIGSIPNDIINNDKLQYIDIGHNLFSNNLPDSLFNLPELYFYDCQDNYFISTLPSQCQTIKQLKYYDISSNMFTGHIPSSYSHCFNNLTYLNMANNDLSGSLSSIYFPSIKVIYLQNNKFSGSISDTFLSGGQIQIFVASLNCFSGTLPDSFCLNKNLSQLILDGLHSSSGCIKPIFPFDSYSSYVITRGVHGSIPSCLFELDDLEIIHISGNDLGGSLHASTNEHSNLTSLILSNNLLTGMIPSSLFSSNKIIYLDLSFNWFSSFEATDNIGTHFLQDFQFNTSLLIQTGLRLQVNHLSGLVPSVWTKNISKNAELNILEGNMFACDISRNDLPSEDPNKQSYECGSDYTNTSLYIGIILLCLFSFSLIFFGGLKAFKNLCFILHNLGTETNLSLSRFVTHKSEDVLTSIPIRKSFKNLENVSSMYTIIGRLLYVLIIWILLVISPIYVILSFSSGTYQHQYVWIISSAYLTGSNAAIVLLLFYLFTIIGIIGYLFFYLTSFPIHIPNQIYFIHCSQVFEQTWSTTILYYQFKIFCILIIEICIVLLVNFSYILAINHGYNHTIMIFISLAISAFKISWGNLMLLGKGRLYFENVLRIKLPIAWILFLSIFNNIIAPYLAEMLVSPNCFLYAITEPPSVNTLYYEVQCLPSFECISVENSGSLSSYCFFEVICDDFNHNLLINNNNNPQSLTTLSYVPPFHYNFTCSSSLLSAFVYIFIYRYLFTGMIEPLVFSMIKYCQYHANTLYESLSIKKLSWGKIDSPELFLRFVTRFLPVLMKYERFTRTNIINNIDIIDEETKTKKLLLSQEFEDITLSETVHAIHHNISIGERSLVRLVTDTTMILSFGVLFPPLGLLIFISLIKDIYLEQYFMCQYIDSFEFLSSLDRTNIKTKLIQILSILDDQFSSWLSYFWSSIWWSLIVSVSFWSFSLYDILGSQKGAIQSLWIIFFLVFSPFWVLILNYCLLNLWNKMQSIVLGFKIQELQELPRMTELVLSNPTELREMKSDRQSTQVNSHNISDTLGQDIENPLQIKSETLNEGHR